MRNGNCLDGAYKLLRKPQKTVPYNLTDNPIQYFAAKENRDLGIVKSLRKPHVRLIIAPFPERQKNSSNFFFASGSQTHLTTATQA